MRLWERSIAWLLIAAGAAAYFAHRPFVACVSIGLGVSALLAAAARGSDRLARLITAIVVAPNPGTPRRFDRISLAMTIGLLAMLAVLMGERWRHPPPLSPLYDDHTSTSLNLAVTRVKCGVPSSVPDRDDVATYLSTHPNETDTPLKRIASYSCSSVHPLVIGENTLMLIEVIVLRLVQDASLATIGRALIALQFTGLALLVVSLARTGLPLLACGFVMLASVKLTDALTDQYMYGIYPLMIPAVGAVIGLLTCAPRRRGWLRHAAFAVAVGLLVGAIGNLRTDLLLICGMLAATWIVVSERAPALAITRIVGLTAGAIAFSILWIKPINAAQPHRLTGHPIMHPIVLALAIPDNPLARELGLAWNDATAFDLAHRLRPGVHVLTPDYEAVLTRFYFDLWRNRPTDMLRLYRQKLRTASRSFAVDNTGVGFDSQLWRGILRPVGIEGVSSWIVPVLFAVGACAGIRAARRFPYSWVFPTTLLLVAGAINWLESVLIFSHFTPQYYAVAFLAIITGCLALYQVMLQYAWRPMNRAALPDV